MTNTTGGGTTAPSSKRGNGNRNTRLAIRIDVFRLDFQPLATPRDNRGARNPPGTAYGRNRAHREPPLVPFTLPYTTGALSAS